MYSKKMTALSIFMLSAALTACGGGSKSSTPPITEQPTPPTSPDKPILANNLTAMCSLGDTNCGSQDNSTYSGDGTGIWNYVNETNDPVTISFNISNVNNKNVTRNIVSLDVNTNNTMDIKNISFNKTDSYNVGADINSEDTSSENEEVKKFRKFLQEQDISAQEQLSPNKNNQFRSSPVAYSVSNYLNIGDSQTFQKINTDTNYYASKPFTVKETAILSDGRKLYIWVESDELQAGKIVDSDTTAIKNHLLNVYDSLIYLNGETYKDLSSRYSNLISDSTKQPLNIMLTNMNYDQKGYGVLGYFSSINHMLKSSSPQSNEALQVFLDTETIYRNQNRNLDINNPQDNITRGVLLDIINGTLSHELTHLMLYTHRSLIQNIPQSTFISEALAESVEDILQQKSQFKSNFFLENRVVFFNTGFGSSCRFNSWSCVNAYEKTSVLMAYLLRKYGIQLYFDITNDATGDDDYNILDRAIKKNGGQSFANDLIGFQVLRSGLNGKTVKGFNLPETTSHNFTLESYNNVFPTSKNLSNPLQLGGVGGNWFKTVQESNPQGSITLPGKSAFVLVVK